MSDFTIYMHRNKINNKVYIGQTCQAPEKRWGKNGIGYNKSPKFWHAIQKYGWDNFEHIILFQNLTAEQADDIEQKLIILYDANGENGYNIQAGGRCLTNSEEAQQNLHDGLVKRWTLERKKEYSNKMKQYYKSLSDEERNELYNNRRGASHHASKKVVCKETGDVFDSLSQAAVWAGLKETSGGNIGAQIAGKKKSAGKHPVTKEPLHWYFLGEESKASAIQEPKTRSKTVLNIEENKIFDSLTEAAKWCNSYTGNISASCKSNGVYAAGRHPETNQLLHWKYI